MAAISIPRRRSGPVSLAPNPGWLNRWVVAALAVLAAAGTLPVLQNSTVTSRGFNVQRIDGNQARVQQQISVLEADIAQLTSLQRVMTRAAELGFGSSGDPPLYVTVDQPGPPPARIPSEYLPTPVRSHGGGVPWWQSLLAVAGLGE